MRIALGIEYAGNHYHGWQAQVGLHTVQGCLEQALAAVANHEVDTHCAGRTDTGVHATSQVVHFDTTATRSPHSWIHGVNSFLPKDIRVYWAKIVNENFHARYSALSRSYRYIIYNHSLRPALFAPYVTWQYRQLDYQLMHKAAQYLIGEHDFTSFRSTECQAKTPMRRVEEITIIHRDYYIMIDITANAFLHHMVRNIAGVLITIGAGRKEVGWVNEVLQAKDRRLGAETAPPYGLYLSRVKYPAEFMLPEEDAGTLF